MSAAWLAVALVARLLLTVGLDIDGSRVVWLLGVVNSSLLSVASCGVSGLLDVVVGILWFASAVVAWFLFAVSSLLVSCRLFASTTATVVAVGLALASRSIVVGCFAQSFGQCHLLNIAIEELLYLLKAVDFVVAYEGDGNTVALGTCCTSDAVNIVFWVVGYIEVDDHSNIVDVNATCYDVGGYEHVDLSGLELIEDFVALSLLKVGVHLTRINLHLLQSAVDGLHLLLLARENDDTVEVALAEEVFDDANLLCFVAYISCLLDFFGRLAYGYLHFYGVLEQSLGEFFNLLGHGSREHDSLASRWQLACNHLYVFRESHVEHAVCLVENKETYAAEVGRTE